jgi:hypothetical protein
VQALSERDSSRGVSDEFAQTTQAAGFSAMASILQTARAKSHRCDCINEINNLEHPLGILAGTFRHPTCKELVGMPLFESSETFNRWNRVS